MKLLCFTLFTFLALAAPSILLAQQSATFENLGALGNSISITGQIAGGERRHAYKFSIAERLCVRIARKDTSVSLPGRLCAGGGAVLQQ
jgi:hypothetical protein